MGGCLACAGLQERQLLQTAVLLFSAVIIVYMVPYVKNFFLKFFTCVFYHYVLALVIRNSLGGDAQMSTKEALKRAEAKYNKETVESVRLRVKKGYRAVIAAHAESQGESTNAFIIRAIQETIERDSTPK